MGEERLDSVVQLWQDGPVVVLRVQQAQLAKGDKGRHRQHNTQGPIIVCAESVGNEAHVPTLVGAWEEF